MEFNDASQYCRLTDPKAYKAKRDLFEFRACSARNGRLYVDYAFEYHRNLMPDIASLMYQFPYGQWSPEEQAEFFCRTIGTLRPHEMVMLDIEEESGIANPADFTRRWCKTVESRLSTKAWIYVPAPLAKSLPRSVTGDRIVKAPKYSGGMKRGPAPTWPHDVHQYSDRGYFPGCPEGMGDVNYTPLSTQDLLIRCRKSDSSYPVRGKVEGMAIENYLISGAGSRVLLCPVGSASADNRQAWLSASTLDGGHWITVYAQGDTGGKHNWTWTGEDLTPNADNLVPRPWIELMDGVTKLVVSWDLTGHKDGALCLETLPRR